MLAILKNNKYWIDYLHPESDLTEMTRKLQSEPKFVMPLLRAVFANIWSDMAFP